MTFRLLFVPLAVLILSSLSRADDWPQFRGTDRTGVSKEKGLLKAWPKGGPKLAWTYPNAGLGFSSVAVAKGVVYTFGTDKNFKDELVIALDEKSGKELWAAKVGPVFTFPGNDWGDGPRSTPTVDGSLLFVLSGSGELVCLDVSKDGKEVWRKNLVKDLNGVMMTKWGYSESPLVDGDHLICTPGGKGGTLAALNKKTGAVVWRSQNWTDMAPYSSMVAANINGTRQYVQHGYVSDIKGGVIAGVEAKTGKMLWSAPVSSGASDSIATTPIVQGNLVYCTTGWGVGCHLFEINAKGEAEEKYPKKNIKKMKNREGGVVLVDGFIYGHSEPGAWVCQEFKSGDIKWQERDTLNCVSGSTIAADGMLYLFTDEAEVGLAEASANGFNLVSKFSLPQKSKIPGSRPTSRASKSWSHPAIANGRLYVRDHENIFVYEIKK